jgi:hypothetical protein
LPKNTLSKEDYSFYYEASVWDKYEDFVYAIERGKNETALKIAKEEGITSDEGLRPVIFNN